MTEESIYEDLGVPRVVNAAGTKTRIGGSLIRPEAVEAMQNAATGFVRLSDLQARASELIADVTGAEAGYVTSGAEAGLLLGAAAAIAGHNLEVMNQLPDTDGVADEIVMYRTHRTGYDRAFRAAGATIVDVGTNDNHLGTGSSNTEPWEIEYAISNQTAAVGYIQKSYTGPPLDVVTDIAHEHDVPVIVDAAAELPPVENFSRFIDDGADLVVFSGGKAIRGPQTTGLVAGRQDLIESIAVQQLDMHAAEEVWTPPADVIDIERLGGVPRQGIGRSMKVGKEELAGIIKAVELFVEDDHGKWSNEWQRRAEYIANQLGECSRFETSVSTAEKVSVAPEVVVTVQPDDDGLGATELVQSLRMETPRVFVGADQLDKDQFTVNPMCLADDEVQYVVEKIYENAN